MASRGFASWANATSNGRERRISLGGYELGEGARPTQGGTGCSFRPTLAEAVRVVVLVYEVVVLVYE